MYVVQDETAETIRSCIVQGLFCHMKEFVVYPEINGRPFERVLGRDKMCSDLQFEKISD